MSARQYGAKQVKRGHQAPADAAVRVLVFIEILDDSRGGEVVRHPLVGAEVLVLHTVPQLSKVVSSPRVHGACGLRMPVLRLLALLLHKCEY
jgi:hypothetical protein